MPVEITMGKLCNACPLKCPNTYVPSIGMGFKRIMLIGEAPGHNEVIKRQPFVGKAGRILDEALRTAGIPRDQIFISNVVKCHPPQNSYPTPKMIESCMGILQDEIIECQPSVILTMGRCATFAILPNLYGQTLAKLHGTEHIWKFNGREILVVIAKHPASVFYSHSDMKDYVKPFLRIKDFAEVR